MRKIALIGAAAAALSGAAPAAAQSAFMQALPDVLGQVVAGYGAGRPDKCYDGRWSPSAEDIEKGKVRVETVMATYREAAAAGTDVSKAFIGSKSFRHWKLDGQPQEVRALRDPWIGQAARLERVALTVGNEGGYYHAQWRAYAADGTELGLYDAWLNANGSRFTWLDLYSPAAVGKPMANTPFCEKPGDAEEFKEAKAKREAEKAAKRAAKAAEQAGKAGQQ